MEIFYDTRKDIPCQPLYELFLAVGWADEKSTTPEMIRHFNIGFLHSTLVFSAWQDEKLVGCIRVLSDQVFRSVIYDLAVHPDYQGLGIGKTLVEKCMACYPRSEWLVETENAQGFYEKIGFQKNPNHFLHIPCPLFPTREGK
ncbi:MAG: GNAT family N-acetyltransferase [Clostridiales bacterium]|nr:GNAT family N-acetyltransferase [Clostridiales bacterium]